MRNFAPKSLLLALAIGTALAGCSNDKPATKSAEKTTETKTTSATSTTVTTTTSSTATTSATASTTAQKINVGSDMTFPPFETMENNEPKGFDIEFMNAVLKQANLSANFIDTRFTNLIPGLDGKKFDTLISGLYITPERLKKVDMLPYFKSNEVLTVLADGAFQPKTRDDICGKAVATQKGAIYVLQLQQLSKESCEAKGKPAITILEFETSPQAVQAVLSKAADAQYDDIGVAKKAVETLKGKVTISSTDPFFPILGGIAVRKGDKETYAKLADGLEKIKKNGEYDALLKKYDLKAPTPEEAKQTLAAQ